MYQVTAKASSLLQNTFPGRLRSGNPARFLVASAILLLAMSVASVPLAAQTTSGNLVGTVSDPSGAGVPNATVQATNVDTNVSISSSTNDRGEYHIGNLLVGRYNLTATASGFAPARLADIDVRLNATQTANLTVQVGQVSTTVEISAASVAIDTSTAQVQSTFDARQIVNMPIIENSGLGLFGALQLSLLSSGVGSSGGVGQGQGPSVGGQRPMNNNFTIEGVDNNNKAITGPLVYVPTEATAEFTLLQNQFAPEYGHSTGGQFNTVVKSGTNEVHGSLYEYFQNRNLNAVDQAFARQGITSNPRFDQNRLGASIGGPIVKNKLFYFANFEYAPLGQAITLSSPIYAPTAAGYSILSSVPGLSQTNLGVLQKYMPAAPVNDQNTVTVGGQAIPVGTFPINGSFYTNQYSGVASVDYNISERDQLRGRYIYNKIDQLDNLANLPSFWTTLPQRFYLASLAEFHNFTPELTNELRLAYNRFNQTYIVPPDTFPGLDAFPNLTIDDLNSANIGPDSNAPQYTIQNTYQLVENINWIKGAHTFKFGYDGRNSISPQHFIQRERGDYEWSTLESYLLDQPPDTFGERNLGNTTYYGNQWANYLYANDNWRIRPNLTLNLGLRWERTSVPLTQSLQSLNAISDAPPLITFHAPSTANKNFAPRVGIAYSPGNSGNTSIRAGFGMAYDVIFDNVGSTAYPPQLSSTVDNNNYPDIFTAPFLAKGGIFPGSVPSGGNLSQADARGATSSYIYDQKLPYSIQWNFGIQHVFLKDYTFEARYLGSRGVHLLVQQQINKYPIVTPTHFLPTYLQAPSQAQLNALPLTLDDLEAESNNPVYGPLGFASNITAWPPVGNSSYHGLALQLNRRFAHGFQMVSSYTWSHNIDDSTATHFATYLTPRRPQDFQNLRADRASSALDRRQRLTINGLWEMPFFSHSSSWMAKNLLGNWRFITTYTYETPEYAEAQSVTDSNLNGDSAGDRTVLNPAGDPHLGSGVTALTNSAGATVAYLADNPNARYITAAQGALATSGRNTIPTRPINNFDMSLGKRFNITESKSIEFRVDASNIFNHPQYTPGYVSSIRFTSQTTSRSFLDPSNAHFQDWTNSFPSNPRNLQLVARFVF
jgi:outer membrane receptor protein involved in Fe transport